LFKRLLNNLRRFFVFYSTMLWFELKTINLLFVSNLNSVNKTVLIILNQSAPPSNSPNMKIKVFYSCVFLFFVSFLFGQNNEKLAFPFRHLLEQQANSNKTNAIPSLFAKTASSRLNKTTGKIDQGYNCIIYTQSREVLKSNGIPCSKHSSYVCYCMVEFGPNSKSI